MPTNWLPCPGKTKATSPHLAASEDPAIVTTAGPQYRRNARRQCHAGYPAHPRIYHSPLAIIDNRGGNTCIAVYVRGATALTSRLVDQLGGRAAKLVNYNAQVDPALSLADLGDRIARDEKVAAA